MEIAGIYLERNGGIAAYTEAEKTDTGPTPLLLSKPDYLPVRWNDDEGALKGINLLGEFIKDRSKKLQSVAVGSYGPFESLDASKMQSYGKLHETRADEPLNGLNLYQKFRTIIGKRPLLTVHTDAAAAALGEAVRRGINEEEILAYICVTEGVGLGIVKNYEIKNAATHPELGLIPLRVHRGDPLLKKEVPEPKKGFPHSGGLGRLASNISIRKRASDFHNDPFTDDRLCKYRAFYLAQACLSITAIYPPHYIVIGADKDPNGDIIKRVDGYFRKSLKERVNDHEPVFEYDRLNQSDFISSPINQEPDHNLKIGIFGLCCAAALNKWKEEKKTQ